ncbi:hypothetical protein DYB31_016174 [Aphanomyces astaci]|uniref:Amine oxidase domain-containing protein n=1 Tax=Aphanomyces astaci TaxID=112090 RepID=A0A397EL33_APHAT|nr:hypothetical protein DYB31_016174 [Aphanomyces astaci]
MLLVGLASLLVALPAIVTASPTTIHMGRHDRIVIVGGGPAGVHYATLLAKKGFTKITIMEASGEIGGKSNTITDPLGYPHEMGTCYATSLYQPVFHLLKEYDPTNRLVPFLPGVKGHTWVNRDAIPTGDYNAYVLQLAAQVVGPLPVQQLIAAVNDGFARYIDVHTSIFGVYDYGLPPQPTNNWARVSMSGLDFLKQNNLLVLEGFFRFVFQQQGYGPLDTAPAFYMLWWVHPEMIRQRQIADSQGKPWTFILSKGYQSLWKAMVNAYPNQIKVMYNAQVFHIMREEAYVYIALFKNGEPDVIFADHIVYAVDLSRNAPIPTDMYGIEKPLFGAEFASSAFVVTLFDSDAHRNESVSQWWPLRGVGRTEGRLQLTRNSRLAIFNPMPAHGSPADPVPTDWGVNATGRQRRVAYQFYNRGVRSSDAATSQRQLLADLNEAKFSNPKLLGQTVHNYFPRYNITQLQQGLVWRVWNNQGMYRTTWIGSSVSFESVLDVVVYNNRLIQRVHMT